MNKEEFESLPGACKKLATTSYIDGFEAALCDVRSFNVRTGSDIYDNTANSTAENIAMILESNLNKMKQTD